MPDLGGGLLGDDGARRLDAGAGPHDGPPNDCETSALGLPQNQADGPGFNSVSIGTKSQRLLELSSHLSRDDAPASRTSKGYDPIDQIQDGANLGGRTNANEIGCFPHILTARETCNFLGVRAATGLTSAQVAAAQARYGRNVLPEPEGKSIWKMLREQFDDLLVRILLGAAFISFALALFDSSPGHGGEVAANSVAVRFSAFVEPIVILVILIANGLVSIWQEGNAEQSLEALKRLQPELARVKRDGRIFDIPSEEVVPGDIVLLKVGDKCSADVRLIEIQTTTFKVSQAQLTGEGVSVCKNTEPLPATAMEIELQAKRNIVFSSTTISHGRAEGVVVATGSGTEIGRIQSAVTQAGEEAEPSPLQQKLDAFSAQLSKVIFAICIVVWLINYRHFFTKEHGSAIGGCIYYFKIAVALAVAAIPEGLPAVITTCLALGTMRMAKRNAIVRKLPSVETLGCTTVICSDKTGTLTTSEMTVVALAHPLCSTAKDGGMMAEYEVEGCNYQPVGAITPTTPLSNSFSLPNLGNTVEKRTANVTAASNASLASVAQICALCNDSTLTLDGSSGHYVVVATGEPTESALKCLTEKLGCSDKQQNLQNLHKFPRDPQLFTAVYETHNRKLVTLEFDRDRKSMSVITQTFLAPPSPYSAPTAASSYRNSPTHSTATPAGGRHSFELLCKGAPESVIDRCTHFLLPDGQRQALSAADRATFLNTANAMSSKALRTLALAFKPDFTDLGDTANRILANPILQDTDSFRS